MFQVNKKELKKVLADTICSRGSLSCELAQSYNNTAATIEIYIQRMMTNVVETLVNNLYTQREFEEDLGLTGDDEDE